MDEPRTRTPRFIAETRDRSTDLTSIKSIATRFIAWRRRRGCNPEDPEKGQPEYTPG
jgi:hypothetical protein